MKGFDVLKIKSAVKARSQMDLTMSHLTTMNFGEIMPLYKKEMIPGGDSFEINPQFFSRLAPLVKPTYGKFSFKTVSAFVPYHMIAADAEAWLAGKTTWEGTTPVQRHFTVEIWTTFIINYCCTTLGATATNSQFTYIESDGTTIYNLFTKVGKYYIKVMNALGYALPTNVDRRTTSTWSTSVKSLKLSAYPFLAFLKLYNDYMSQSQRFNTSQLSNTLNAIKYGRILGTYWNSGTGALTVTCLGLLASVVLCYENDYFTSAWQSANNPLAIVENVSNITTPATGGQNITESVNVNYASFGGASYITQRALDFLKSFDNWVRRNNYSGSRAVQQIYSRFGFKTDDFKDHYAHIIKLDEMPVQVGDVTATADATGVPLGDYAGKGIMSGNSPVRFEATDYGMAFILGFFTVTPMNAFGYDREVLRSNPLDYYNPEFDGLGADAISVGEYYTDPINTSTVNDNDTYGFTERYNDYRYGRDKITGEFADYHANGDMNCWHTGRNMSTIRTMGYLVAQNSAVNTMPQTDSEYNRIFSNTSGDVDHFYLTARFNVKAIRPMMNLNQIVGLGEGETNVPRNGNVIA